MLRKKNLKNLLLFSLLLAGLLAANWVMAQGLGLNAVSNGLGGSLTATDPRILAGRIINIVLGFLGIVAVSLIIYSGFIWMTSNGDEEKVAKAKNILKDAVIGLVIILASWGIATFILSRLGGAINGNNGNSNNPSCTGSDCILPPPPPCQGSNCTTPPPPNCQGSSDPNCQASAGHPVIKGVSPLGGFCTNNLNKSCRTDSDCSAGTCNLITPNGAVNNFISIFGQNFGTYSATSSKIIFLGQGNPLPGNQVNNLNPACLNSWSNTQIVIAVPKGVTSGALKIINKNKLTDTTSDNYGPKLPDFQVNTIVRPGLCSLSPQQGKLSAAVGYSGVNLYSGSAYFGNYQNNVPGLQSSFTSPAGLNGTSTIPNIKSGVSSSFIQTKINGSLENSNYLLFTKQAEPGAGPFISSFSPTSGNSGQYVTINGSGFGETKGKSQVYFGNTEADYSFPAVCLNSVWSNNRIIVKVPKDLANGPQAITIKLAKTTINTQILNPNTFQFDKNAELKTGLCKIDPSNGPAGTPVSLWGEYFGTVNSGGLIKFNFDKTATGTIQKKGQADFIQTKVPANTITGPVKVIKNSDWGNSLNFKVGSCAVNADCSGSQVCCPQNTYKQGRCTNNLNDCLTNIPTSVFEWSFNTGFGVNGSSSPSADPCSKLAANSSCVANTKCCIDAGATGGDKCKTGEQIASSTAASPSDVGYCAYYSCSTSNSKQCASTTPAKTGDYKTAAVCISDCPQKIPCAKITDKSSCTNRTNCCIDAGATGDPCTAGSQIIDSTNPANDGYCAYYNCKKTPPLSNSKLCASSTPSKSGSYKGIDKCVADCGAIDKPLCGCTKDADCVSSGLPTDVGCGTTDCCDSRPKIASTSPKNLADNVCRNALVKVNFDQNMDVTSFRKNVLLLEQRDYTQGTCPTGTVFAFRGKLESNLLAQNNKTWWRRLSYNLATKWSKLINNFSGSALAEAPNPDKLYCSVKGLVYGENNGTKTSLVFRPSKLLDSSATYYLVVKGDEKLNSKTGALSSKEIGFNGSGYFDGATTTPGALIRFNNHKYIDSQIIKFSTLSSQGPMAGICAINKVTVNPPSYLFNTTTNALQSKENDSSASSDNKTFDTITDSDKVFTATAYSVDKQILQPVSGYSWNWDFSLSNSNIASISSVPNLPPNKVFITAAKGITDGETKVVAKVNMTNFVSPNCTDNCNAYLGGNDFNSTGDIHVFICNNPWPPVLNNGTWYPWSDNSTEGGPPSYNYQFYYCRDSGGTGTLGDLPALNSQPVTIGQSAICSSDHSSCSNINIGDTCGPGQNGVCVWNTLKQSYFFRAPILAGATIISAIDQKIGGTVKINWQSNSSNVYSYKIYYLPAGSSQLKFKEVKATSDACKISGTVNTCSTLINNLTNDTYYIFQITVISTDKTESTFSDPVSVMPSDQVPPAIPTGLNAVIIGNSNLKFTWATSTSDTVSYRLYHGISSGKYGEYFNSVPPATSLSFSLKQFSAGKNYFALSAFDSSNNESAKSSVLTCTMSLDPAHPSSTNWSVLKCN